MNMRTIVWREITARPANVLNGTVAILLGVAAFIAIRHITTYSESAVKEQLMALGANVLVLPKDSTLQDYYAADLNASTLPESHVASILLANLAGVERISPKLTRPIKLEETPATLTGILPQREFQANAAWQSVSLFSNKHVGCAKKACSKTYDGSPESLATMRSIDQLADNEAVLGVDVAEKARVSVGEEIDVLGDRLRVVAVLPRTGTVDDSRVFAHLHTVQRLTNAGEVVNAIEIMGCCDEAAGQLVPSLSELLPDAKVVTISQVVATQVGVNRLMSRISLFVMCILILVGAISIGATIASNVRERRREIGTLMALGTTPRLIAGLFLLKAWYLGSFSAVIGCVLGIGAAMLLGSQWVGVSIYPLFDLVAITLVATMAIATLAAYLPARSASRLDPCSCFMES